MKKEVYKETEKKIIRSMGGKTGESWVLETKEWGRPTVSN